MGRELKVWQERKGQSRVCDVEGCEKKHYSRGFCKYHYYQLKYPKKKFKESLEKYRLKNKEEIAVKRTETIDRKKKEKLVASGVDGVLEQIKELTPVELDLLRAFLLGNAVIIYKDNLRAKEEAEKWYLRVDHKARQTLETILDHPTKSTPKTLLDTAKEIMSRIVPPKQEIVIKDPIKKRPIDELLKEAKRRVVIIAEGGKAEKPYHRKVGRPGGRK